MANPVYSQALIQYTADTPNTAFLVPPGYVAVVRQISGWQDIGGWVLRVYVQDSEAAPPLVIAELDQEGALNYAAMEGRWVVDEGGYIAIFISSLGDTPCFYVGGYLIAKSYSR